MKTYTVKIKGASDMLHNRLSKDLIDEIKKVPRAKLTEWEEKNWNKKLYTKEVDGKIVVILPELVVYATLGEACKKYKIAPPTSIGRTWTQYFKSSIIIPEPVIIENCAVEPFGCMVNGNPSSAKKSSKVYKVRPCINKKWSATLKITDLGDFLDKDVITGVVTAAGQFVGFCDWRPLYGRFSVESVIEDDD